MGDQMIDVKATNIKLQQRARNILRFVGGEHCTQTDEELDKILESCHGSVKLAAATIVLDVSAQEAKERLERHKGVLSKVFEEDQLSRQTRSEALPSRLVLCVDAGGSSCKAAVASPDGTTALGVAGPCNVYVATPSCKPSPTENCLGRQSVWTQLLEGSKKPFRMPLATTAASVDGTSKASPLSAYGSDLRAMIVPP